MHVGPTTGVAHYFAEDFEGNLGDFGVEIENPDATFLPIGGTGRVMLGDAFYFGADLAYALGLNDGNDGGFLYRPRAGFMVSETVGISLSYTGISNNGTFNSVNGGVTFKL